MLVKAQRGRLDFLEDLVPLGHCLADLLRALPFECHDRLWVLAIVEKLVELDSERLGQPFQAPELGDGMAVLHSG